MLFVFLVFLGSYLGLTFGWQNFLKAQIETADTELQGLASQVSDEDQKAFLQFQFQLLNLKTLLTDHVVASKMFPLIEANTNQKVQYTGFAMNVADARVDVKGTAQSYAVLAEQLLAYERMPQVLRYQVTNSQAGEGGRVNFGAVLFFDKALLKSSLQ